MGEEKRVLRLEVEAIRPNPRQPRRLFDEGALRELAASIRRHGVIQPLVVRRRPDGWELVAGERRLRAARLAGLAAVPCVEADVDERESALLALVENLQRQDLHYFEEAAAIADYLRRSGVTQEEAAAQLGRSASAVANKLRLLKLPEEVLSVLRDGLGGSQQAAAPPAVPGLSGLSFGDGPDRASRPGPPPAGGPGGAAGRRPPGGGAGLERGPDGAVRGAAASRAPNGGPGGAADVHLKGRAAVFKQRGSGAAHRPGGGGGGQVPSGRHGGGNCHDHPHPQEAGVLTAARPLFLVTIL